MTGIYKHLKAASSKQHDQLLQSQLLLLVYLEAYMPVNVEFVYTKILLEFIYKSISFLIMQI